MIIQFRVPVTACADTRLRSSLGFMDQRHLASYTFMPSCKLQEGFGMAFCRYDTSLRSRDTLCSEHHLISLPHLLGVGRGQPFLQDKQPHLTLLYFVPNCTAHHGCPPPVTGLLPWVLSLPWCERPPQRPLGEQDWCAGQQAHLLGAL